MRKCALITGCYGQDGSYLAEQLLEKGYEVHGICRATLSENARRIKGELEARGVVLTEHTTDLEDYDALCRLLTELEPMLLFHVAAIHHSAEHKAVNMCAADRLLYESNVTATGRLLCACMEVSRKTRVLTAGSCLMYDNSDTQQQDETTPYDSQSMYGTAKITEALLVDYYRKKGLFACVAVLYNHESHRRSEQFVTRKIAEGLKRVKAGQQDMLRLGDISAQKDWGYAGDYTEGMYRMLTASEPKDYILATGELHSIREYIAACAAAIGLDTWQEHIEVDDAIISRKIRGTLKGDPQPAMRELGWERTHSFTDLVDEMMFGGMG